MKTLSLNLANCISVWKSPVELFHANRKSALNFLSFDRETHRSRAIPSVEAVEALCVGYSSNGLDVGEKLK